MKYAIYDGDVFWGFGNTPNEARANWLGEILNSKEDWAEIDYDSENLPILPANWEIQKVSDSVAVAWGESGFNMKDLEERHGILFLKAEPV